MAEARISDSNEIPNPISVAANKIPKLVNNDDVMRIIDLQVAAISRLEKTNDKLVNCNTLAQGKLSSTTKLFKRTTKQMNDTKKDLDVVYRKILELKAKIRAERPDLFALRSKDNDDSAEGTTEAKEAILGEDDNGRRIRAGVDSPTEPKE